MKSTESSESCKTCIDSGNTWCPTAQGNSGFCCEKNENCPREGSCSNDLDIKVQEQRYTLCPNDAGCMFDRVLRPPMDESVKLYENLTGVFKMGDVCSFKVQLPPVADLFVIMFIKIEFLKDATATLIKTEASTNTAQALYRLQGG